MACMSDAVSNRCIKVNCDETQNDAGKSHGLMKF